MGSLAEQRGGPRIHEHRGGIVLTHAQSFLVPCPLPLGKQLWIQSS